MHCMFMCESPVSVLCYLFVMPSAGLQTRLVPVVMTRRISRPLRELTSVVPPGKISRRLLNPESCRTLLLGARRAAEFLERGGGVKVLSKSLQHAVEIAMSSKNRRWTMIIKFQFRSTLLHNFLQVINQLFLVTPQLKPPAKAPSIQITPLYSLR